MSNKTGDQASGSEAYSSDEDEVISKSGMERIKELLGSDAEELENLEVEAEDGSDQSGSEQEDDDGDSEESEVEGTEQAGLGKTLAKGKHRANDPVCGCFFASASLEEGTEMNNRSLSNGF